MLDANAKERKRFPSGPATLGVVKSTIGGNEETRNEVPVPLDDNGISLSTASTHERRLKGVIGEMDATSVTKSQRFVDQRLAIRQNIHDSMASAQDKQKQYADQNGR